MANIFLIADTHFGHANILKFTQKDGITPIRLVPETSEPFNSVEAMDEYMVMKWNSVVKPSDHVYHLGDVVLKAPGLGIIKRLNGHKRLVRGNHDIFKTRQYIEAGFDEIYGVRILDDMILSHIPLHPLSVKARWFGNVHGHLHNSLPQFGVGPNYYNVSVEMIDYTPVPLEVVKQRLKANKHE